jgi:hypothetical protein
MIGCLGGAGCRARARSEWRGTKWAPLALAQGDASSNLTAATI